MIQVELCFTPSASLTGQCKRVYEYMEEFGSITPMEGFADLGVTRLADVVYNLKKRHGIEVETEMISVENRYGEKCRVAKYRLEK